MHVLGTPPAFILSQDRTLRSNFRVFKFRLTWSARIKVMIRRIRFIGSRNSIQFPFSVSGSQGSGRPSGASSRSALAHRASEYITPPPRALQAESWNVEEPTQMGRNVTFTGDVRARGPGTCREATWTAWALRGVLGRAGIATWTDLRSPSADVRAERFEPRRDAA